MIWSLDESMVITSFAPARKARARCSRLRALVSASTGTSGAASRRFSIKVNDGQVDVAAQAFPDPARLGERLSLDRLLEVRLLFEHDRENFSEQAEVLHDQSLAHLRTPTIVPPFSEAATLPSVHPM
jgi:hypothetical protein